MDAFYVKFRVNCETKIKFNIKTRVDVSCMAFQQARSLGVKIDPTVIKLKGPGRSMLKSFG